MEENLQQQLVDQTKIPNQPVETVVLPPKPKSILFYLFSMLAVVFLGVAYYFYNQTQALKTQLASVASTSPKANTTNSTDQYSNWNTYKNEALGFELMYPTDAKIVIEENDKYNRYVAIEGQNLKIEVSLKESVSNTLEGYFFMDNPNSTDDNLGSQKAKVYVQDVSKNNCIDDNSGPACPKSSISYVSLFNRNYYHLIFYGDTKLSDIEKKVLSSFKFIGDEKVENILQIIPTLTTPMVWSKPVSGTLSDLDGKEIYGTIITAPTPSKQDNKLSPLLESNSILTTQYGWSNMQGADGMGEQIVTYEKESKKLIILRKNNQYQILLSK